MATIQYDEAHKSFRISGPGTFALKDRIKALPGARFWGRGASAYWSVPEQHEESLRQIVAGQTTGETFVSGNANANANANLNSGPAKEKIKIAQPGAPQAAGLRYPATFTAGDGLRYQVAIYTVPLPVPGQILTLGESPVEYIIAETGGAGGEETPPVDWASAVLSEDASQSVEIELRRGVFTSKDGREVFFK